MSKCGLLAPVSLRPPSPKAQFLLIGQLQEACWEAVLVVIRVLTDNSQCMVVIVIDHGTICYKLGIRLCLVRLLMSRPLLAIRKNAGESTLPFHIEAIESLAVLETTQSLVHMTSRPFTFDFMPLQV